jgi:hypothetical protein
MRLGWVETPLPLAESRRPGLAWAAVAGGVELELRVVPPPMTPVPAEIGELPMDVAFAEPGWRAPPIETEPARPAGLAVLAPVVVVDPPPEIRDPLPAVS